MFIWNKDYAEISQDLSVKAFVDAYGHELESQWKSISWDSVTKHIFDLQEQIFRVIRDKGDYRRARTLENLVLKSKSTLLFSIKKITEINKGRNTPGVDGMLIQSDAMRMALFYKLYSQNVNDFKASPVRRTFIPKKNGKKRPLGIPTIIDRIIQTVVHTALEPRCEAIFEPCSYGFRHLRGAGHAIARIHSAVRKMGRPWIFEGDFKSCFDTLSHEWILEQLGNFPAKKVITSWLKSGYLYNNMFRRTITGTPQGGIISPLLANIALHGMEEALNVKYQKINNRNSFYYRNVSKYLVVRYADDFVVLCKTKEDAQDVYKLLEDYLYKRGLTLAEDKTLITHISDGFNFLGFNIRSYNTHKGEIVLAKPSQESIQNLRRTLRFIFDDCKGDNVSQLIKRWNNLIVGVAMYWRKEVAKRAFSSIDNYLYILTKRYLKRLHSNKPWKWIKKKYFKPDARGISKSRYILTDPNDNELQLTKMESIPIKYERMIKYDCSPYDRNYFDYILRMKNKSAYMCLYQRYL